MNKPAKFPPPKDDGAFRQAVKDGLEDADKGRAVPYAKVRRWLLSWGSVKELSPPK